MPAPRSPADIEYAKQRRTVIGSATVEVVERDGRTFELRRLPSAPPTGNGVPHEVRPHRLRYARVVA